MSGDHMHDASVGPDLWRVLEMLVWASIGVLLVIGAEALGGYIVRERIAAGAQRHLAKVDSSAGGSGPASE